MNSLKLNFIGNAMKANFYVRVKFQNFFSGDEAIFNEVVIDESMFGNQSNSIQLIGNIDEDFDDVSPLAVIINKSSDSTEDIIEKLFLYNDKGDEDSWSFITNILEQEFDLDSSDDDQEMVVDSIVEALFTFSDYEPSSLGKKYISREFLEISKISKKQASKINYFIYRAMAHFNTEVDFGKKPSSASIEKTLLKNNESIEWLDKFETIAIAFKK
jgi:hypothetical protein